MSHSMVLPIYGSNSLAANDDKPWVLTTEAAHDRKSLFLAPLLDVYIQTQHVFWLDPTGLDDFRIYVLIHNIPTHHPTPIGWFYGLFITPRWSGWPRCVRCQWSNLELWTLKSPQIDKEGCIYPPVKYHRPWQIGVFRVRLFIYQSLILI